MSRRTVAMVSVLAIALVAPTVARAEPPIRAKTVAKFGRKKVIRYAHLHRKWVHRSGAAVVGRQIVKQGMPKHGGGKRVATRAEWRRTMRVFDRWEHPPRPPAPPPTLQATGSSTAGAYAGGSGGYSIPGYIVECESGGDYNAQNPSGAYGAYQIMPEHWGPGGVCYGLGRDPAGQDACAARIWASSGPGAWSCS